MVEWRWTSPRLDSSITMTRWGEVGTPVLVFPTRSGDAYEIERNGLVSALGLLLADRRVKVYSIDDPHRMPAGGDPQAAVATHNLYNDVVIDEVVPMIREDCHSDDIEIVTAGMAHGTLSAITVLCRIPDVVAAVVGMSGSYDPSAWLDGEWSDDVYFVSPLHFVPGMADDEHMDCLRSRFVLLASGTGSGETPRDTWWLADVLGERRIPNRADAWPGWSHGWETWRQMLPGYLHELVS